MAAKRKSIIVTVADEGMEKIDDLATTLKARGMSVDRVMRATGVISGSVASTQIDSLRKLKGVHSVEAELRATLPPPDAPVQ